MVLLRVMLGGSRRPDLVDVAASEALAVARAELQTVLGIRAAPAHVAVHAWPQAIAQYTLGHQGRCRDVQSMAARHGGLWLCGTSYDGVAFNDAIKSGHLTAQRVAEQTWGASASRAEPDLDAAGVRA
jgi:oxygen-dependent protoporphyrinogen oxidase